MLFSRISTLHSKLKKYFLKKSAFKLLKRIFDNPIHWELYNLYKESSEFRIALFKLIKLIIVKDLYLHVTTDEEASNLSLFNILKKCSTSGLRGDPHFYKELFVISKFIKIPKDAETLTRLLNLLVLALIKENIYVKKSVFVKRYQTHGMSAGHVSSELWCTINMPRMIEYYNNTFPDHKKK